MTLLLTRYLDAEPNSLAHDLDRAIDVALDSAAERISVSRDDMAVESIDSGRRIRSGLDVLEGAELRISGGPRLTTVEISVPWTTDEPNRKAKLLAANRFAHVIASELSLTV